VSENRVLREQIKSGPTIHASDLSSRVQDWPVLNETGISALSETKDLITPLLSLEKEAILRAIEQLHGNKSEAAKLLGIGKTTLYRKLKGYGANL